MEVVARRGFDATVEEIAQLSGVSPRTIFRHYTSHDRLILATVKDIFEACGRRAEDLGDDVDAWLESMALTIHTRNVEILGDAFWDIHSPSSRTSEVLSEVNALRRESRVRGVSYLTSVAWEAAGGRGDPPEDLVLAFALYFSAFATQALTVDFRESPVRIGELTADLLKMLLWRAVQESSEPERGMSSSMPFRTDEFEAAAASNRVTDVRIPTEPHVPTGTELPQEGTPL
jgi:AcrR family transcriptional regulator